jgi:uncharacterized membrane protein YdjX (TVP38/TMEM64 family)
LAGQQSESGGGAEGPGPPGLWWRPALLATLLLGAWVVAWRLGVGPGLANLKGWVRDLGAAGVIAFIGLRAASAVAMVPGSAVSATAGWLFGPVVGIACVSAGKTLGAAASFIISRRFARRSVAAWAARKGYLCRLDGFMAGGGGLDVLAFCRLVPLVPFNAQNYVFGLTGIRFGGYLLVSWLFMLPGAVFVVTSTEVVARVAEATASAADRNEAVLAVVSRPGTIAQLGVAFLALLLMAALAVVFGVRLWRRRAQARVQDAGQALGAEEP